MKQYTVTKADKVTNTPAYQKLMEGDPRYKAAKHLLDDKDYMKIQIQHGDGP